VLSVSFVRKNKADRTEIGTTGICNKASTDTHTHIPLTHITVLPHEHWHAHTYTHAQPWFQPAHPNLIGKSAGTEQACGRRNKSSSFASLKEDPAWLGWESFTAVGSPTG